MQESQPVAKNRDASLLILGVDTCGPSGSVALVRTVAGKPSVLGQTALAGRSYSATLVTAVEDLFQQHRATLREIAAIVVAHGPGSFTGVRVGLSAVKGLAEPTQIPVVAVSRLEVLAAKAGVEAAALDAHRHEVFLRLSGTDGHAKELLAGAEELAQVEPVPAKVAICDDGSAALLGSVWNDVELVRSEAPTAADAIGLCLPAILAGNFADLALLDGHYLRRSDAEIFGAVPRVEACDHPGFNVRRMVLGDLERVMEMAAGTHHAPGWPRSAYERALDPGSQPRRIALVAEEQPSGVLAGFAVASVTAPEAELESIVTALAHRRRGVARELFGVLKSELRRQGVREVILEVRAGNRAAQGFHRFLGFAEEGRRPGYYAQPVEDAILMRMRLT